MSLVGGSSFDRLRRAVYRSITRGALLMAKRDAPVAKYVLDTPQSTLLDVLDNLLNKGVLATGDVTLGVAGIDLIYLRLSSILCAADRVMPHGERITRLPSRRRSRHRRPGGRK